MFRLFCCGSTFSLLCQFTLLPDVSRLCCSGSSFFLVCPGCVAVGPPFLLVCPGCLAVGPPFFLVFPGCLAAGAPCFLVCPDCVVVGPPCFLVCPDCVAVVLPCSGPPFSRCAQVVLQWVHLSPDVAMLFFGRSSSFHGFSRLCCGESAL